MANTPCTVKDITLVTVFNSSKYSGGIDKEGMELPDVQFVTEFVLPTQRTYYCNNCNKTFDGSETFDECKKHFGTFPLDKD